MKKEEKIYKTDNFYLSSFLIAKGQELYGIEPMTPGSGKYLFCFNNNKTLQLLVKEFYSLKALVRPQDFANAQKSLRSIIYQKQKT